MIADKGQFFTEEFLLINAEVMTELEYYHITILQLLIK